MQLISVYLYSNKIDVFINQLASWKKERYRSVYNRNLKAYRGVDNRIDLQVRNSDQKAIEVSGTTLVFTLVERDQQKKILERDCEVISAINGRFYVILTEQDFANIEPGFYQYSIRQETREVLGEDYVVTAKTPVYLDSQYGVNAAIEIFGSIEGEVKPSTEIREFSQRIDIQDNVNFFISSIIDARPEVSNPQKKHTFQFFFDQYEGMMRIQGSLSLGGNPGVWSNIVPDGDSSERFSIQPTDTNLYKNITGKYNWFRVIHEPGKAVAKAEFVVEQTILLDYVVNIRNPGLGYAVNDVILILGNRLGGETPTNDLIITVDLVDGEGRILTVSWTGISYNGVRTFVVSGEASTGSVDKILYR